jgi:hypothetical protein
VFRSGTIEDLIAFFRLEVLTVAADVAAYGLYDSIIAQTG